MSEVKVRLDGLTCAHCAGKIEDALNKKAEAKDVNINMIRQELTMKWNGETGEGLNKEIRRIVNKYAPEVSVSFGMPAAAGAGGAGVVCPEGFLRPVSHKDHCCDDPDCHEHSHEHHHHHDDHCCDDDCCAGHEHHHHDDCCDDPNCGAHSHEVRQISCGCGCCGEEGAKEHTDNEKKIMIARFVVGLVLFFGGYALEAMSHSAASAAFIAAYVVFGWDVVLSALKNISHGQMLDENFLMSVSTIGAIGIGQMPEAVFVMLFYQVGEAFQEYAVKRSRKSITSLLEIRPDSARLVTENGAREVSPEMIRVGDVILVKAGERVPLDGVITEGSAMLDTAALTGESLPANAQAGDEILSGCINMDGTLKIRVDKPFAESTVVKILEMVENAAGKKSRTERFITRFARVYTPAVVGLAVALAVLPPILGFGAFSDWFGRALIFLVVSCPCALVLSVPLTYFAGIGAASREGILVKGGESLDVLAQVKRMVFDKTGTLTKGSFSVTEIEGGEEVLKLAAAGEAMSNHPIAKAVMTKYHETVKEAVPAVEKYQELGGYGISYENAGSRVLLGNARLMEKENISYREVKNIGTVIHAAKDGKYMGYLLVADTLKDGIGAALKDLRSHGVKEMVMLTGDRKENAQAVADELGLDEVYAELLPEQKAEWMDKLRDPEEKTAFVGDGINDAPVLAGADLGIAMGGIGSDAAIEAADLVLMEDDIAKLATGMKIAHNTRRILHQNIVFALGVKIIILILGALGLANMWLAAFGDVGVTVIAICNAMRKKS